MKVAREPSQAAQRIRVGLIGLFAVILLIGVASTLLRTATRNQPIAAIGEAPTAVVANMTLDNGLDGAGEPLAELGITASTGNTAVPARGSGR